MSILFYTAASEEYEYFVPLYTYFALRTSTDAYVEIGLEDAKRYKKENEEQIEVLRELFGSRFKYTTVDFEGVLPGAVRFLTKPTIAGSCEYVYIGDIDILLFDNNIKEQHLNNMEEYNAPFSNSIRPPSETEGGNYRLTGLHFAPTDVQYPLPDLSGIDYSRDNTIRGADENILYEIMKRKGKTIPREMDFRPEHGIHIRAHSHPFGTRGKDRPKFSFEEIANGNQNNPWSGLEIPQYRAKFLKELTNPEFRKLYFTLDIKAKNMINILENACEERYNRFEDEAFTYIIAESYYESLARKGMRSICEDGIPTTTERVLNYFFKTARQAVQTRF